MNTPPQLHHGMGHDRNGLSGFGGLSSAPASGRRLAADEFGLTTPSSLLLVALALVGPEPSRAAALVDKPMIARTIKADVAEIVAGLNAHDAVRTTALDAPDIISMDCGDAPSTGMEADREGFAFLFAHDPHWKVSLIDETVDVAGSGDLAVYRGAYNEDNGIAGVVMTHKTNFIAEFKRQPGGPWKMDWYIVANMEKGHPK